MRLLLVVVISGMLAGLLAVGPASAEWNTAKIMSSVAGDSVAAVEVRALAAAKIAAGDSARKAAGDSVAAVAIRALAAAKAAVHDSLALALLRSEIAAAQALPLPDLADRTGIVNVPDSVLAMFEDPGTNEESMYLRSYGGGHADGDTVKIGARHTNLIKSTADTAYVYARTDSATALIKVIITVKDMAGNTVVSGTVTPTVDATWSRAAFPLLLTLDAEEVVITYTVITVNDRYVDVTALRLKEAS